MHSEAGAATVGQCYLHSSLGSTWFFNTLNLRHAHCTSTGFGTLLRGSVSAGHLGAFLANDLARSSYNIFVQHTLATLSLTSPVARDVLLGAVNGL